MTTNRELIEIFKSASGVSKIPAPSDINLDATAEGIELQALWNLVADIFGPRSFSVHLDTANGLNVMSNSSENSIQISQYPDSFCENHNGTEVFYPITSGEAMQALGKFYKDYGPKVV